MGVSLGPFYAETAMQKFERKHMETLIKLGVKYRGRYVDDITAKINKKAHNDILNYLNSQHKTIKFTIEHQKNNKLPFLDTTVIIKDNKLYTTLYHKPTFTGVYLNWTSLTSRKYKIGLIKCLLDRIWKICSQEEDINTEIEKLKTILAKNEYPKPIIEKEITNYIKRKTQTQPPQLQYQQNQQYKHNQFK